MPDLYTTLEKDNKTEIELFSSSLLSSETVFITQVPLIVTIDTQFLVHNLQLILKN